MAYEAGMGIPVIATGNGDGFMGGGGLGGLLIGALISGGFGGFGGWGNRFGAGIAGADLAANGLQNQINGLSTQLGNLAINQEQESMENTITTQLDSLALANQLNLNNVSSAISGLAASLENTRFTNLTSINDLGRDVISGINQQTLQQLNSANILNTTMLQGFNEIGRDTMNATNQIIAGQTAMSSQMAACCCEIKQAISADGQATRALINDIRLADIQGQLTDAKLQISNSAQTATLIAALGNGGGHHHIV